MSTFNVTDEFLLIVDSSSHEIIDTIQFSKEFKFKYDDGKGPVKYYSIEDKNGFFDHPYLKNSFFIYGDITLKVTSKAIKQHDPIKYPQSNTPDIPVIYYDLNNSSKYYAEAEIIYSDHTVKVYLILSGVRARSNETCYADVLDELNNTLYINIPVSGKSATKLYMSSNKEASVNIDHISENYMSEIKINQQTKNYHSTIKISKDFTIITDLIVADLKPVDKNELDKKQKKLPFDAYSATWKTAWDAAGIVANKEVAIVPFGKQFKEAFTKKFTAYVGIDKNRGSALELSFNEDKFFTRDEIKELIDKYNVFNNLDNTIDTKGNGMYINDGGIVIRNTMNSLSINDEGIDVENLRLNTSVMKSSSGIIPVETETVASNDIRPVSNLMLTAPRRIPNIYKLKRTFDMIYALTKMSVDLTISINKQTKLYEEYHKRVKQEEAKESQDE